MTPEKLRAIKRAIEGLKVEAEESLDQWADSYDAGQVNAYEQVIELLRDNDAD